MIKPQKNLVMIIGHQNPHFIIDTADSVKHYNPRNNYEIVFAIDNNEECGTSLKEKYGPEKVFITSENNGWGRGVLRTFVHALDYFEPLNFRHVFTMDSDALCVGPFVDQMLVAAEDTDCFFVGHIWPTPTKDHGFHFFLRNSGFMGEYSWNFNKDMAAGPCMLWTSHCLNFLHTIDLRPAIEFDNKYPLIHFAHDQLSTYLNSCGVGKIVDVEKNFMMIRWRKPLPTFRSHFWRAIPITYENTAILHPTQSCVYNEVTMREYFKVKRDPNLNLELELKPKSFKEYKEILRKFGVAGDF